MMTSGFFMTSPAWRPFLFESTNSNEWMVDIIETNALLQSPLQAFGGSPRFGFHSQKSSGRLDFFRSVPKQLVPFSIKGFPSSGDV